MKAVNNNIKLIEIKQYDLQTLKDIINSKQFKEYFADKKWDDTYAYKILFKSNPSQLKKNAQYFDFENYNNLDFFTISNLNNLILELKKYFFERGNKIIGQNSYYKAKQLYQLEIYLIELKYIKNIFDENKIETPI